MASLPSAHMNKNHHYLQQQASGSTGDCWPFAFLPPHDQQLPAVNIPFMQSDFPALAPKTNNSHFFFPLVDEGAAAAFPPLLFALDGGSSNSIFSNEMQRLAAAAALLPPVAAAWGYQFGDDAIGQNAHHGLWSRGVGMGQRDDMFGMSLLPPAAHVGVDAAVATHAGPMGGVGNFAHGPHAHHPHAATDTGFVDWTACAESDNDSNAGDGAHSHLSLVPSSCVSSTIAAIPAAAATPSDAARQLQALQPTGSVSPLAVSASSGVSVAQLPSSPSVSSVGSSFSSTAPSSAAPRKSVRGKKRQQSAKKPAVAADAPLSQPDGPKRRTHLTRAQREYMVALFERNHTPDTAQLREAAVVVGMTLRHAQYWFQNRRSAMRKKGLLERPEL
ncbi:hypothetical protein HDU83_008521 [Entophlyctis luteolus]|nr:hypothetical protein HDU83_008521 [Entophlyctis luteolus]